MFDLFQCPWAELNYDGILYVQPRDLEFKAGEDCRNVKPIQWQYPTHVLSGWRVRVRKQCSYVKVLDKPFLMVQVWPKLSNKYAVACHWVLAVPNVIFPATWICLLAEFAEGKWGTIFAYRGKIGWYCIQYSLFYNTPVLIKKKKKKTTPKIGYWLGWGVCCALSSSFSVESLSLLGLHM